ncbi:MAG TPA: CHRD domain-containing protein [Rubrobacteraceae bacterium]|nr:CHRD domain-containing protein [Rubrobacteraceae bacterium]
MLRKTTMGMALTAALLMALLMGTAWAHETGESQTLQLTPSRDSGVSGTATLTPEGDGLEVHLDLTGLPKDGVEHLAHIHKGATCADDRAGNGGAVAFPLENVLAKGGEGGNVSTVDTTLEELSSGGPFYINVHDEQTDPKAVPPGVACADIAMTSADGSGSVPQTGGISPITLLMAAGAALVALGVTTGFVARRRPL